MQQFLKCKQVFEKATLVSPA